MYTTIIIPARYKSSRFPGKPLAQILGKSLVRRSFEAARTVSGGLDVYVATDSDQIRAEAEPFGAQVIMTPEECKNGTERVYAAAKALPHRPDIVINLQGDAPLTPHWYVEALLKEMMDDPSVMVATPALRCNSATYRDFLEDRKSGAVGGTTVVFNKQRNAMYFSKEVIPYVSRDIREGEALPVFHHVGLYVYKYEALAEYGRLDVGPMEKAEQLEQLRFLENDIAIRVVEVFGRGHTFWELNNPHDIKRIESILRSEGDPNESAS